VIRLVSDLRSIPIRIFISIPIPIDVALCDRYHAPNSAPSPPTDSADSSQVTHHPSLLATESDSDFQFLLFRFPITEGISLRKTPIRNFARRQLMMMMMVSGGDQVILTLTSVPCEWGLCQIQWPQDLERRYDKIAPLTKVICQKSVMTSIQFMRCYVVMSYQENTANNDTFCGKNMKYILLNTLFLCFFFLYHLKSTFISKTVLYFI